MPITAALTLDSITLAPIAVLALSALAYLAYLWTSPKAFCAGEVTAIYIYPLKSARGISVKSATLDERGLEFDRLWMAVDDDGTFLSQRRAPKLALIEVSLPKTDADPLQLRAPGARPLSVPVVHEVANTPTVSVRCWDDQCDAVDQGDEAAAWLATVLGVRGVRAKCGPALGAWGAPTKRWWGMRWAARAQGGGDAPAPAWPSPSW